MLRLFMTCISAKYDLKLYIYNLPLFVTSAIIVRQNILFWLCLFSISDGYIDKYKNEYVQLAPGHHERAIRFLQFLLKQLKAINVECS